MENENENEIVDINEVAKEKENEVIS